MVCRKPLVLQKIQGLQQTDWLNLELTKVKFLNSANGLKICEHWIQTLSYNASWIVTTQWQPSTETPWAYSANSLLFRLQVLPNKSHPRILRLAVCSSSFQPTSMNGLHNKAATWAKLQRILLARMGIVVLNV